MAIHSQRHGGCVCVWQKGKTILFHGVGGGDDAGSRAQNRGGVGKGMPQKQRDILFHRWGGGRIHHDVHNLLGQEYITGYQGGGGRGRRGATIYMIPVRPSHPLPPQWFLPTPPLWCGVVVGCFPPPPVVWCGVVVGCFPPPCGVVWFTCAQSHRFGLGRVGGGGGDTIWGGGGRRTENRDHIYTHMYICMYACALCV